jgi:hypothetical protein
LFLRAFAPARAPLICVLSALPRPPLPRAQAEQYDEEVTRLSDHPHVKAVTTQARALTHTLTQNAFPQKTTHRLTHTPLPRTRSQETDRLVSEVMRVMLFRRHKDGGAPVARSDLTAIITKAYKDKRSLPGFIIAVAQRRFLSALGLEMRALDKAKRTEGDAKKKAAGAAAAAAASATDASNRAYVLRSALPARLRAAFVDREADAAARGLAVVVCSLAAIAGESGLPEDTLWSQLASLGFTRAKKDGAGSAYQHQQAQAHPSLGDADAALEALIKARYVQRGKGGGASGADAERKIIELAENGIDELGHERLSAFIKDTMKVRIGAEEEEEDDEEE